MTRRSTPDGISNTETTTLRILTLLQTRIKESTSTSITSTTPIPPTSNIINEIISNTFLEILIIFWDQSRLNLISPPTTTTTTMMMSELYEVGISSRLPEILKNLFELKKFDSFNLPQGVSQFYRIS